MKNLQKRLKGVWCRLLRAEILKVFSLTSLSTFIKMLTGFVTTKAVSVFVGPAGIALVGQLQNFSTILMSLSNGGISNGIVKYVAEHKDNKEKLREYMCSSFTLTILCSFVCALFLIIANKELGDWVFNDTKYGFVFIAFGISITLYSVNILLISILNGLKQFRKYVIVNIFGSIIGMVFTVSLVFLLGISGALIAVVTYQSVVLIITYFMVRNEWWLNLSNFRLVWNKIVISKLAKYSVMAIVTAVITPLIQMMIRNHVIEKISIDAAGYWEGMNRLSSAFIVFVSTSFAVYYLPKLSESKTKLELKHEIYKMFVFITPIVLIMFLIMFLLRIPIINLLYTEEFNPMKELFLPQFIGDYIKIVAWVLSYILLAKSMMKEYLVLEITTPIIYLVAALILVNYYGVVGIVYSYIISIIFYLAVLIFIFRDLLKPSVYGK